MNKFLILYLGLATLLFSQCKKEESMIFDTYHAVNVQSGESQLELFIDGKYKGLLPYADELAECADEEAKKNLLHIRMPNGKHFLEARDSKGTVHISGYLTLGKNRCGVSGGVNGMSSNISDNVATVLLFK